MFVFFFFFLFIYLRNKKVGVNRGERESILEGSEIAQTNAI